jgi:DNA-directed RNA polymerase specialized sigma subunit
LAQCAPDVTALVEAYVPLALSLCRRAANRLPWLAQDFVSDAMVALWRSAVSFVAEDDGIAFATYAKVNVRRAIAGRLRHYS